MTRTEVVKTLSLLKAAFPHSYKDATSQDLELMVQLWERQFRDNSFEDVSAAVDALISSRTTGYSPTIGEIKEQMHRLHHRDDLDELAAWALVSKACRNGLYGYREEFAKLPPDVQAAVGAPEQLRAWAMMDTEAVESVVASNFQRNYRTTKARQKELDKLPADVRKMVSGIADHFMIGGD